MASSWKLRFTSVFNEHLKINFSFISVYVSVGPLYLEVNFWQKGILNWEYHAFLYVAMQSVSVQVCSVQKSSSVMDVVFVRVWEDFGWPGNP
jgi:hypothetical protein